MYGYSLFLIVLGAICVGASIGYFYKTKRETHIRYKINTKVVSNKVTR
jgi:hypothetical protein